MKKKSYNGLISASQVKELLDYNPETGIFTWRHRPAALKRWNVRYEGQSAGSRNTVGYIILTIFKVHYLAHRLAWLHCHGEWPQFEIDHIDGDRANNALSNLRKATHQQNSWNGKSLVTNRLGHRYVSFCTVMNKFLVQFMQGKDKRIYKAYFDTIEEAIADRDRMAAILKGEFVRKPTIPVDISGITVYP